MRPTPFETIFPAADRCAWHRRAPTASAVRAALGRAGGEGLTAKDLADLFGLPFGTVSFWLGILKERAGIAATLGRWRIAGAGSPGLDPDDALARLVECEIADHWSFAGTAPEGIAVVAEKAGITTHAAALAMRRLAAADRLIVLRRIVPKPERTFLVPADMPEALAAVRRVMEARSPAEPWLDGVGRDAGEAMVGGQGSAADAFERRLAALYRGTSYGDVEPAVLEAERRSAAFAYMPRRPSRASQHGSAAALCAAAAF